MGRHDKSSTKNRGLFVTFEGTEGAGKSTLIRIVAERLQALGLNVVSTREPGGTPIAEKIRSIILGQGMNPWTELFLYEASRAEHIAHVIQPALNQGHVVLCDRFTDSSLAYQAHARGLPWKDVDTLNHLATQGIRPVLTVLLDVDPAVGLNRAQEVTRFEAEGEAFQRKVRAGYLKARNLKRSRWLVLRPKSETPDVLAMKVITALRDKKLIKAKSTPLRTEGKLGGNETHKNNDTSAKAAR